MDTIEVPSKTTTTYLELLFAVLVWGASFIATKIAVTEISPLTLIWLRFGLGVIILGGAVLWRGELRLPNRKELGYFALLGFLGITFHTWLQATGLQTAQATTTAWIVTTTPVYIAILGWLFLSEKLGRHRIFGIAFAFIGVVLVISKGNLTSLFAGTAITQGDLLILVSSPNWAIFTILSRNGLKRNPPARMMFYVMLLGWLFTSLLFFTTGSGPHELSQLALNGWLAVLFLGVFCSGLAYIAWYDGLSAVPAYQAGAFLYLEPLVATIVAAALLAEPLLWTSLLGGAVILLGVWMVQSRQREKDLAPRAKNTKKRIL